MARRTLTFLLAMTAFAGAAHAYPFQVRVEKKPTQSNVIGVNEGYAPVTVILNFASLASDRSNVRPEDLPTTPKHITVPPRATLILAVLHPNDPSLPYWAKMKSKWYVGDERAQNPEPYAYRLPFSDGVTARTSRSRDSLHGGMQHQFDLDFELKEWTGILAARAGTVFEVSGQDEEEHGEGIPASSKEESDRIARGTYIRILHTDGTYAEYANLMPSSGLVREGQQVVEGERIAFAGKSAGAGQGHLHFGIYRLVPISGPESVIWIIKTKKQPTLRPDPEQTYRSDYNETNEPSAQSDPPPVPRRSSNGLGQIELFGQPNQERPAAEKITQRVEDHASVNVGGKTPTAHLGAWIALGGMVVVLVGYQRGKAGKSKSKTETKKQDSV